MKPIKFNLDIMENSYETCDLLQGYDYNMSFTMTDNYTALDLTGSVIQVQMQKADHKFIIQTEKITVVGNVINVEIDKDLTRDYGQGKLQVVLVKEGKTFGSWVVKCNIKESALNDNDGQSENKVAITEALTNSIAEAKVINTELDKNIINGNTVKMRIDIDKNIDNIDNNSLQLLEINRLNYDNGIKTEVKKHTNGTTMYITTIPYNEKNTIKKSFANNHPNTELSGNTKGEYPRNNAQRVGATFATNGSAWYSSLKLMGVQIKNGVAYGQPTVNKWWTLGVRKDGSLSAYDGNATNQTLLDDNVYNSFCFSIPIIMNGAIVSNDILDIYKDQKDLPINRQIIGQKANGDYVIFTCDGRSVSDIGLTINECVTELLKEGCIFAYNLDGGGSVQTISGGSLINAPRDVTEGSVERLTGDILYFSNADLEPNKIQKDIYSSIADVISLERLRQSKVESRSNKFGNLVEVKGAHPTIIMEETSTGYAGIALKKDGTLKSKLSIKEDGLQVYDYTLQKSLLNLSTNGDISFLNGVLGEFFKGTTVLTVNPNTLTKNGFYWINSSTPGYTELSLATGVLIHIQLGNTSSNAIQLMFPMNTSSKKRSCSSGTWGQFGLL